MLGAWQSKRENLDEKSVSLIGLSFHACPYTPRYMVP
jgi:hypothetical protein